MSLLSTSGIAQINGLSSTLGINSWQIQEASWNGYKFSIVSSGIFNSSSSGLGQATSVIGQSASLIDSTELTLGMDQNTSAVPPGSKMVLQRSTDVFNRRVAINSLPNGKDNIRDLGYHGQDIVLYGIAWGTNYLNALKNNLINMFYSDQLETTKNSSDYHILIHPFYGRIPNTWLLSMTIVHESIKWRACVYEMRFRTEEPLLGISTTPSFSQMLNNTVSGILGITSALTNIWSSYQYVTQGNPQNKIYKNNAYVTQQVTTIQQSTLDACNNTVYATKILTANLAPTNYNNNTLNKTPATTTLSQLDYFKVHYTPQDVNNMVDIVTSNVNVAISNVYKYGANNYYDTLSLLQGLITKFSQYAEILLYNYYGQLKTYIVPRPMSLFTVCQINNIDYESNVSKIISVNQGKFFILNNLPVGLSLLLPEKN